MDVKFLCLATRKSLMASGRGAAKRSNDGGFYSMGADRSREQKRVTASWPLHVSCHLPFRTVWLLLWDWSSPRLTGCSCSCHPLSFIMWAFAEENWGTDSKIKPVHPSHAQINVPSLSPASESLRSSISLILFILEAVLKHFPASWIAYKWRNIW